MPKLTGIVDVVDNALKSGKRYVYEFENLSENDLESVKNFYSETNVRIWSLEDKKNSTNEETKYRIAIPNKDLPYGGQKNA